MNTWILFFSAFLLSLIIIPLIRKASIHYGRVAVPSEDRWHRKPTPSMGGVGIFLSFFLTLIITSLILMYGSKGFFVSSNKIAGLNFRWGFLAGSVIVFFLGLYDDFKHISPQAKLVGQIIAATIVIALGFTTNFFTPRISNQIVAQLPNILLTILWLVGITNAINLLDNMDGLAGGITVIAALILGYFFWRGGDYILFWISISLAGSILGFLIFNFPPASIFMGNSGSMFIGFTLATLAIARQPQASNVFAILGVPSLIFLLPILDTALVTITRLLRGQSPAKGGKDHTSHRLIAFGLTERQAVISLYAAAILSGIAAIAIEAVGYWLSIIFVPIIVISMALMTAYLAGVRIASQGLRSSNSTIPRSALTKGIGIRSSQFVRIILEQTFKRRLLEVMMDFVIILTAYYLAYITRYGLYLNDNKLDLFVKTLPIALGCAYFSFFYFGIYRGVWRYVGINDLIRYFKAAVGSMVLVAGLVFLLYPDQPKWPFQQATPSYSPIIFILYGIFLFLGLAASRSSFKILDTFSSHQIRVAEQNVLIYGASDAGEMALRWISINPELMYHPIGFIDNDPFKIGRKIHGIEVLGGIDRFETILDLRDIKGVIIAGITGQNSQTGFHESIATEAHELESEPVSQISASEDRPGDLDYLIEICQRHHCWVRTLRLEFELVE